MLPDHHQLEDTEVVHGKFLEPGGDAARFLEPPHAALDLVATAIRGVIELERATALGAPALMPLLLRNDSLHMVISQPKAHCGNIVALVPCTISGRVRGRPQRPFGCGILTELKTGAA